MQLCATTHKIGAHKVVDETDGEDTPYRESDCSTIGSIEERDGNGADKYERSPHPRDERPNRRDTTPLYRLRKPE